MLLLVVGGALALAILASLGWRLSGGAIYTIATPSMCPDLCVGTLVLDQPLHGPVEAGMVVSFRPPGVTTVYTHRVVRVLPSGAFKTAGDALGTTDPWTVPRSNVIGRVVSNVRGLGWLWRCLPAMTAALACFLVVRRSISNRLRSQWDLLAVTLIIVVPVVVMRPLLRVAVISWHPGPAGSLVLKVANVGLLPSAYQLTGAPPLARVDPGQIVTLTSMPGRGGAVLRDAVSLSGPQWGLAALVLVLPVLLLVVQLVRQRLGAGGGPLRAFLVRAGKTRALRTAPGHPLSAGGATDRYGERPWPTHDGGVARGGP